MKAEEEAYTQKDRLILRPGFLIDGSSGSVHRDRLVTILDGKFASIIPFNNHETSKANVVDLSHCTVIPALMDAHVHFTLSGTVDPAIRRIQLEQTTEQAHSAIARHIKDTLQNGIIAVRHGGDCRGDLLQFNLKTAQPLEIKATGWAWHAKGRYGGMIGQSPPGDQRLDQVIEHGLKSSDHIKIINSGLNSLDRFGHETQPQFSKDDLKHVCRYARQNDLTVMVHANGQTAVRESIEAGCHSIEHGYFMGDDNLQRMADRDIAWVPTVVPMHALTQCNEIPSKQVQIAQKTLDHQLEQINRAHKKGVTIVCGTDAGSYGVDHGVAVRQELRLLMEAGLSPGQAVRSATKNVSRLIGLKKQGLIQPGCRADFIIVAGDPDQLPVSLEMIKAMYVKGCRYDIHLSK